MSQSTIFKIQTTFVTLEFQTGSREFASMFDLYLLNGEDQRKLVFIGENTEQIKTVRVALCSYAGAYPENLTANYAYKLLLEAIAEYEDMVKYSKDSGDLQPPKFNLVVEVTLTT
jgi:hypothetical protein